MVERNAMQNRADCHQYAHIMGEGEVLLRELIIPRNSKLYTITVTTPQYLNEIRIQNEQQPDPNLRFDINPYTLNDISKLEDVCRKLSTIPFEELEPFIEEIREENEGNGGNPLNHPLGS